MLPVLFIAACGAPSEDDSGAMGSSEMSRPRHPTAAYNAEEAANALKEGVRFGLPLPPPAINTWREFMLHGDEICPGGGWEFGALEVFETQGCTADSGYWYQGVGSGLASWTDEDGDGLLDQYREDMKTDGSMRDLDDQRFIFGGAMRFEFTGIPGEAGTYTAEILGTYAYPGADDLWMQAGASTGSYLSGTIDRDDNWTLLANGGFTVGDQSVGFADFSINTACPGKPSGTIGIRDDAGYWYDLTYDESTCDTCGDIVFDGREALGRVCVDVGPAFDLSFNDILGRMAEIGTGPP